MKKGKKPLFMMGTMALAVGSAWGVASLFDIAFVMTLPKVIWFAMALGAELAVVWLVQQFRGRITAKTLLGVVLCISLVLGLGFGLVTAVKYLLAYLESNGILFTSFPWYWGFGFAQYLIGPVVVVTGMGWLALHIWEDRRNVRDVKLLVKLVMAVIALWAVIDTVSDVRGALLYGNGWLPWHAQMFSDILKYGLLLLILGAVLWGLGYWEKCWKAAGLFDAPPTKPAAANGPKLWRWGDLAMVTVPLLVIGGAGVCFWDSAHRWYNLCVVVGNALSVCLLLALAAWLAAYHFGSAQKLRHLRLLDWGLILLTLAAAVVWMIRFNQKEVYPLTGLRADTAIHLGILSFAPLVLGEVLGLLLILRLEKRLWGETEKMTLPWAGTLLVLCLGLIAGMWGLLNGTEFHGDVPISIVRITADEPDSVQFQVQHDVYHCGLIYTDGEHRDGHRLYLMDSVRWAPFGEVKPHWHYHNVQEKDGITEIYHYKSPGSYVLAAVKDPQTGIWQLVEE